MRNRLSLTTLALVFVAILLLAGQAPTLADSDSGTIPPPAPIFCLWESFGPADQGFSLYVNSVDASSSYRNDRMLFAATTVDIQQSSDGGKSWRVLFTRPDAAPDDAYFSHVRAAPAASLASSPATIFALLYAPGPSSSTLYRSEDAGATWVQVSALAGAGLPRALAVSPNFAVDRTVFAIFGQGLAIHKSTDGGQSWAAHAFGPIVEFFNGIDLAISPAFASDQTLYAAGFGPLHMSVNGGLTWSKLATLSPTFDVAVSPQFAADRRVWTTFRTIEAAGDDTPEAGVQRSTDAGAAWALGAVGLPGVYEPNPRFLSVSPRFDRDRSLFTLLKGDSSLGTVETTFRSFDGGAVWADQFTPPNSPAVNDAVTTYALDEGVRIHLATAAGVWSYSRLCEQRLINPGFETGWQWAFSGGPTYAAYTSEMVYAGRRALKLGITSPAANAAVTAAAQQTITVPAEGVAGVTLAMWMLPQTTEPAQLREGEAVEASGDRQYVRLHTSEGPLTLWEGRTNAPGWQQRTFDLTAYAGKTIRIELGAVNDGGGGVTALFADNVTVNVGLRAPSYLNLPLIFRQDGVPAPTPTATALPSATPSATPTQPIATPTPTATSTRPPTSAPTATPTGTASPTPAATATSTATPTATPTGTVTATPSPTATALPRLLATLNLGARVRGIAVSTDGQRGYAGLTGDDGRGRIGVLTLQPLTMTHAIALGPDSSSLNDVALNQVGRLLFAAEREAGTLAVVDVVSNTLVGRLAVGELPNGVAVQRYVGYVANFGSSSVSFFNPATGILSGTLSNAGSEPSLFAVETNPVTSTQVFLSLHGADQVVTYAGMTPVRAYSGLDDAYGLAFDPTARRLYVANRGPAHKVSVIDAATHELLGSISTAEKEPYVAAVNPSTGHLFVVCDEQVRIYRTSNWSLVKIIALAAGYDSRIAVDPVLNRVYITDFDSRTLSVVQDGG